MMKKDAELKKIISKPPYSVFHLMMVSVKRISLEDDEYRSLA
jgi:hypothetical protein